MVISIDVFLDRSDYWLQLGLEFDISNTNCSDTLVSYLLIVHLKLEYISAIEWKLAMN